MELPQKLKYLRKQMGLSQLELSEKLQVSRQAISGWEAGISKPSTDNLKRLGHLYEVPLEYLLSEDEPKPIYVEQRTEKDQGLRSNIKKRSIVLILMGVGLMLVILCSIFFMNKNEEPSQMDDMERSEVETNSTNNFKLEF